MQAARHRRRGTAASSANAADLFAVIFDLDGVLVDSYRLHLKSWQLAAAEAGVTLTEEQFAPLFGRTAPDVARHLWKSRDLNDQRVVTLCERKRALYREMFIQHFSAMDGAVELIDALNQAGFRLAIGSAGPSDNAQFALNRLGRSSLFPVQVTSEDVTRGKPDPEVFLTAAQRLGVAPNRCAAIEDAPAGIAAARAAGMAAIGLVSNGRAENELASASRIVHSLRELSPESIRALITTCLSLPKTSSGVVRP